MGIRQVISIFSATRVARYTHAIPANTKLDDCTFRAAMQLPMPY